MTIIGFLFLCGIITHFDNRLHSRLWLPVLVTQKSFMRWDELGYAMWYLCQRKSQRGMLLRVSCSLVTSIFAKFDWLVYHHAATQLIEIGNKIRSSVCIQ